MSSQCNWYFSIPMSIMEAKNKKLTRNKKQGFQWKQILGRGTYKVVVKKWVMRQRRGIKLVQSTPTDRLPLWKMGSIPLETARNALHHCSYSRERRLGTLHSNSPFMMTLRCSCRSRLLVMATLNTI